MKIATNQPYMFFLSRFQPNTEFVFLDAPQRTEVDEIILLCADIFGDSGIEEIIKLTALIIMALAEKLAIFM